MAAQGVRRMFSKRASCAYLIARRTTSCSQICSYFHAFGQIPWASLYLRRIPAIARTTQRLVAQGRGLAIQRVNNGSLSRDLFYYLVSSLTWLSCKPLRALYLIHLPVEQRRRGGNSHAAVRRDRLEWRARHDRGLRHDHQRALHPLLFHPRRPRCLRAPASRGRPLLSPRGGPAGY